MDIDAINWSSTDASNTTAAPDGAPEGMSPGGVNNVLRANMGAIKRYRNHLSPKTTAGTSTAYTLTYDVAPGALYDGATFLVQFHAANGAAATLNVHGLGAAPLHYYAAGAWRVAPTGLLGADQVCRVTYNTLAGAYRILRPRDDTGEVVMYAGATAPAGALLCYGQAVSRTDYAGLFAALSDAHGVGDGSSTFNLPDLRGYVAAGKSNMGGSDNGVLTGGTLLGNTLGAETHTLSIAEMPAHAHNVSGTIVSSPSVNFAGAGPFDIGTTTSGSAGSGGAHNNVQPTLVLNYVIRI